MKKLFSIFLILTLLSLSGGSALAQDPTAEPTQEATAEPTQEATAEPTQEATAEPTQEATAEPTQEATAEPTQEATAEPTQEATAEPTQEATAEPTQEATAEPTVEPTVEITPTATITVTPTITEEVSAGEISDQALTSIPFTSRVGVMDTSGAGATFSLSYYDESTVGGGSRGTNSGLTLAGNQMRIIDQATDSTITGALKGSAVLQSNSPLAAAVFFGGTLSGATQFEAYDSGGFYSPGTQFFIPNGNKNVGAASRVNSEIAVQNTDPTTSAVVDVLFVVQGVTKSFTVAPNSTYYYIIKDDTSLPLITNQLQQPLVITSRNGQNIMVVNSNFSTVGKKFLSDTPGFKPSDAAAVQFLPNVQFRLTNGLSVVTFVQNVSANPVNVTATFVPDPTCTIAACLTGNRIKNVTIQPNQVASFNPRTDTSLPARWFGSARISTDDNSASIIAFANQLTAPGATSGTAAAGYGARNSNNTNTSLFCPYLLSGLPNYTASSQAGTLLVQNIGGGPTNVTVQFVAGVSSPSGFSTTKAPVTLQSGERLSFNFRVNNAAQNGGVPANWFGSAKVTSDGGKLAGVVNLFNKISSTTDPLGSYNCISPQ